MVVYSLVTGSTEQDAVVRQLQSAKTPRKNVMQIKPPAGSTVPAAFAVPLTDFASDDGADCQAQVTSFPDPAHWLSPPET